MVLQEIINAINKGQTVYYKSLLYKVLKDFEGDLIIKCSTNNSQTILVYDGKLQGDEQDFFILKDND